MPGQQQEKAFISQSGFYKESLCYSVLGSTTAITDANGSLSQHVLYFAYGETFVDEHRNSTNSPYLFNGKEYDEETGRYYYGARYYDPRISIFISVDPLAKEFPWLTPYQFASNEVPNAIDLEGLKPYRTTPRWGYRNLNREFRIRDVITKYSYTPPTQRIQQPSGAQNSFRQYPTPGGSRYTDPQTTVNGGQFTLYATELLSQYVEAKKFNNYVSEYYKNLSKVSITTTTNVKANELTEIFTFTFKDKQIAKQYEADQANWELKREQAISAIPKPNMPKDASADEMRVYQMEMTIYKFRVGLQEQKLGASPASKLLTDLQKMLKELKPIERKVIPEIQADE